MNPIDGFLPAPAPADGLAEALETTDARAFADTFRRAELDEAARQPRRRDRFESPMPGSEHPELRDRDLIGRQGRESIGSDERPAATTIVSSTGLAASPSTGSAHDAAIQADPSQPLVAPSIHAEPPPADLAVVSSDTPSAALSPDIALPHLSAMPAAMATTLSSAGAVAALVRGPDPVPTAGLPPVTVLATPDAAPTEVSTDVVPPMPSNGVALDVAVEGAVDTADLGPVAPTPAGGSAMPSPTGAGSAGTTLVSDASSPEVRPAAGHVTTIDAAPTPGNGSSPHDAASAVSTGDGSLRTATAAASTVAATSSTASSPGATSAPNGAAVESSSVDGADAVATGGEPPALGDAPVVPDVARQAVGDVADRMRSASAPSSSTSTALQDLANDLGGDVASDVAGDVQDAGPSELTRPAAPSSTTPAVVDANDGSAEVVDAGSAGDAAPTEVSDVRQPARTAELASRIVDQLARRDAFENAERTRGLGGDRLELEVATERFGVVRVEASETSDGLHLSLRSDGRADARTLMELAAQLREQFDRDGVELAGLDVGADTDTVGSDAETADADPDRSRPPDARPDGHDAGDRTATSTPTSSLSPSVDAAPSGLDVRI